MIKEITAKSILSAYNEHDPYFGTNYTMNLYRGCQHHCIYCDSRSDCYKVEDFDNAIEIKTNAIELLNKELCKKRVKGTIGTGSMNDPYMPIEKKFELTRQALKVIYYNRFPVHIITKGVLVTRDTDIISDIGKLYSAVSFTITTPHDDIAKKIEPGAAVSSDRLSAMKTLAAKGVYTGVTLMPILPFITDSITDIATLVSMAADHGAQYIISGFGVTLRDKQRDYYLQKLDAHFPHTKEKHLNKFGTQFSCNCPNAKALEETFNEICYIRGIDTTIKKYQPVTSEQFELFST